MPGILQGHADPAEKGRRFLVQGQRVRHLEDRTDLQMILQVLPDAGERMADLDAMLSQLLRRPDAGEHHQLRRAEGAGGEDYLATGA